MRPKKTFYDLTFSQQSIYEKKVEVIWQLYLVLQPALGPLPLRLVVAEKLIETVVFHLRTLLQQQ
jgi:hypothetical protein